MILLLEFNRETKKLLIRISKQSKFSQVRKRSNCIILAYQGFSLAQSMSIFRVSRRTVYNWFSRCKKNGVIGLYNEKETGRKSKLSPEQKDQIKNWVKEEPKNLKKVAIKIQKEWNIEVHQKTIKRIIKKLNMLWKKMKRGLSKSPDEWEIEVKIPKLIELKEQDKKGKIDLRYLDESGFSLMPSIPYAWQEKETTITLKSSQSQSINVLGLMNVRNELFYEIHSGIISTELVIKILDNKSENLSKMTVVVLDQTSIHTSNSIKRKIPRMGAKKIKIILATYLFA